MKRGAAPRALFTATIVRDVDVGFCRRDVARRTIARRQTVSERLCGAGVLVDLDRPYTSPSLQVALVDHIQNVVMCHRLAEVRRVRAHYIITQQRLIQKRRRAERSTTRQPEGLQAFSLAVDEAQVFRIGAHD